MIFIFSISSRLNNVQPVNNINSGIINNFILFIFSPSLVVNLFRLLKKGYIYKFSKKPKPRL